MFHAYRDGLFGYRKYCFGQDKTTGVERRGGLAAKVCFGLICLCKRKYYTKKFFHTMKMLDNKERKKYD